MSRQRILKLIHFASTGWFILCAGGIFALALRQAGFHWWVIFSLSGHSALIVFLLISLYLFAIFRGMDRGQKSAVEHPLSSSTYYSIFYDVVPFLGAAGGGIGMFGGAGLQELLSGIALGTFGTTFMVWVIVDPSIGYIERFLPAGRHHRIKRLARLKALRQRREIERKQLLERILEQEQQQQIEREKLLMPWARKLAGLLTCRGLDGNEAQKQAVTIGAEAWRLGGIGCMKQLHSLAMDICNSKYRDLYIADYVSIWWDGIGSWRSSLLY